MSVVLWVCTVSDRGSCSGGFPVCVPGKCTGNVGGRSVKTSEWGSCSELQMIIQNSDKDFAFTKTAIEIFDENGDGMREIGSLGADI